jgi:DNA-binding NtrC family response regulator
MQETAEENSGLSNIGVGSRGDLTLVACGPDRPRSVTLAAERDVVIGRHESCQLSLSSPKLSRFHARFVRRGAHVVVEDLGSRHGTWLAGQRVERAELALGASVRLADVVIALAHIGPPQGREAPAGSCSRADPHAWSDGEALYLSSRSIELRSLLHRVAPASVPVLLQGETGTGKELAAREIHAMSGRRGALRVLNCAAIPANLVEATLFGHERGAFTGADRARPSIFEEANGGTLLLDEVGELPLSAQAALLRTIETRRVTRVGSHREIEFDVRIVSATHRDLQGMTERGTFRLDLMHRLCVVAVELSPLRERRDEIAPLARHFLAQQAGPHTIDPAVLTRLEAYDWPGNVRELCNVIARAAALARGSCIELCDLPGALQVSPASSSCGLGPAAETGPAQGVLKEQLRAVEHEALRRALAQCGGNQRRAAELLGLPLRTFERRLQSLRSAG